LKYYFCRHGLIYPTIVHAAYDQQFYPAVLREVMVVPYSSTRYMCSSTGTISTKVFDARSFLQHRHGFHPRGKVYVTIECTSGCVVGFEPRLRATGALSSQGGSFSRGGCVDAGVGASTSVPRVKLVWESERIGECEDTRAKVWRPGATGKSAVRARCLSSLRGLFPYSRSQESQG